MADTVVLAPAYGRQYKNKAEVTDSFEKGNDFIVKDLFHGGGVYATKAELKKAGITHAEIRYGKHLEKVMVIEL